MPSQAPSQLRATVAANLDVAITERRLTNRAVADAVGSTEHQVWRWRKGRVRPNDVTLAALAVVLERDLLWFYTDHSVES